MRCSSRALRIAPSRWRLVSISLQSFATRGDTLRRRSAGGRAMCAGSRWAPANLSAMPRVGKLPRLRRGAGCWMRGSDGALRRHGYAEAMRDGRAIRSSGGAGRFSGCAWCARSIGLPIGTGAVLVSTKCCGDIRCAGCSREKKRAALSGPPGTRGTRAVTVAPYSRRRRRLTVPAAPGGAPAPTWRPRPATETASR